MAIGIIDIHIIGNLGRNPLIFQLTVWFARQDDEVIRARRKQNKDGAQKYKRCCRSKDAGLQGEIEQIQK
ncbi:hypothetical protein GCK32_007888 [Trichostrongylus colubriformis]|uniref:Uncharacterized protein n=1 Tax=Trichostrongylus colubriformis TaxID=6319 RepID=A0AAN8EXU7_TRICO